MGHKVVITRLADHSNSQAVADGIRRSVQLLGGIEKIVEKGDRVIIKPNLEAPREARTAATTDMIFVETAVEMTRESGAVPIVAEGPFMNYNAEAVFQITGVRRLCERLGVEFVNLNAAETIEVEVPGGKAHKKLRLPRVVLEADKLLNLPKLKTHHLTTITCAMKNLKGVLPGQDKQLSHVRGIHQAIVDINKIVRSDLVIVDGLLAMEGMGPTFGGVVDMGVLTAGTNAIAVDSVCAEIMGMDPLHVPHLKLAYQDFSFDPSAIEVVGTSVKEVQRRFKVPRERISYHIALRSAHILDRYIYKSLSGGKTIFPRLSGFFGAHPKIDADLCTRCDICETSCPAGAIDLTKKRIDTTKCIDCLICFELCPNKAVIVKGISAE